MNRNYLIDNCNDVTQWTVLNADVTTLAAATNYITGTGALSFAKTNGAANSTAAGIYRTYPAGEHELNLWGLCPSAYVCWSIYASALTNVASSFLRLGSSSTTYLSWAFADSVMTTGWSFCYARIGNATVTSTGWNGGLIKYAAAGLTMDAETDALAGIIIDRIWVMPASEISL